MPRPPEHLLDPTSYPYEVEVPTRFDDVDSLRHINNVAIAAVFQEGRARFSHGLDESLRERESHSFTVSVHLEYLDQSYYPDAMVVKMAVEKVGTTSITLVQLALQGGEPKAFCRTTDVLARKGAPVPIPAARRAHLAQFALRTL